MKHIFVFSKCVYFRYIFCVELYGYSKISPSALGNRKFVHIEGHLHRVHIGVE
jgi:hypothetical protein